MPVQIGVVGAGNRGKRHAGEYDSIDDAEVVAVADIDQEAATELADEFDVPSVYGDYREMIDEADLDAVSVCVHNNLHRSVTVDAAEAGYHVFCEKPIASTYADAAAMVEATEEAGVHLGVQNVNLFSQETRAARRLIDHGELGEVYYGRGSTTRRRGRPFVDGYATPAFVSKESAGGGPVIDIGTYVVGQLLYLLGNAPVERVGGTTFEFTDDAYAEELTGDNHEQYTRLLEESGYDVEDVGEGFARLADGSVLTVRAAWHMFLPGESTVVAGSQGGVDLDDGEYYTTTADYEATVDLDVDSYESRQGLIESDTGYEVDRDVGQFDHWIDTLTGAVEDPIPTGDIAFNSMRILEGIYLSQEAGRELSAEEIAERSESTAINP